MKPYIVLATYVPKRWKSWIIGPEICEITRSYGLVPHNDPEHGPLHLKYWWYSTKLHAEVRVKTLSGYAAKKGEDWHQDGDLNPKANMDCALVTWANVKPTEYRWNGNIYAPEPFQVVIARNLEVYHRRPPDAPAKRWLFRQRVAVPTHLSLPTKEE